MDATAPSSHTPNILPVKNATVPYWRSELHPIDEYRSTRDLPSECDIAIIGAGMSGVATAYHLAKKGSDDTPPSMVLLEARQVCSGATGRNGGHAKIQTSTVQRFIKRYGFEAAMEIVDLMSDQPYAIKQAVESEALDCEFELRRSYDVFLDEADAGQAQSDFEASLKAGERWTKRRDLLRSNNVEQVCFSVIVPFMTELTNHLLPGHFHSRRQRSSECACLFTVALQIRITVACSTCRSRSRESADEYGSNSYLEGQRHRLQRTAHCQRHGHSEEGSLRHQRVYCGYLISIPEQNRADSCHRDPYHSFITRVSTLVIYVQYQLQTRTSRLSESETGRRNCCWRWPMDVL